MTNTPSPYFQSQVRIKFHQADPAGIMFFGHIFTLTHDTYEAFIQACGFQWNDWFLEPKHLVPIRHTECDFLRPFRAGELFSVRASVCEFSTSSFKMKYDFLKEGLDNDLTKATLHATVKMVHTCLDHKTFQKTELPQAVRTALSRFYIGDK